MPLADDSGLWENVIVEFVKGPLLLPLGVLVSVVALSSKGLESGRNALKYELKADMTEHRVEITTALQDDVAALKNEIKDDVYALKTDMTALRNEIKDDASALKESMTALKCEIKANVAVLKTDITVMKYEIKADITTALRSKIKDILTSSIGYRLDHQDRKISNLEERFRIDSVKLKKEQPNGEDHGDLGK